MTIPPLKFPKTNAGWDALRHCIKVDGLREAYPDGPRLIDTDWDEIAVASASYFDRQVP